MAFPLCYVPSWHPEPGCFRIWPVFKLVLPVTLPRSCVASVPIDFSNRLETPMEERTMSYSFLGPLLCLPRCLSNSKCSTNVGEIRFVVLSVAMLPMRLVYGCRRLQALWSHQCGDQSSAQSELSRRTLHFSCPPWKE